jgi:hypothetical protein
MIRNLEIKDVSQAVVLDNKWFGRYGISAEELKKQITDHPNYAIGIFDEENLLGFAVYEILQNTTPKDYVGDCMAKEKTLFIQQFTTQTNYNKSNSQDDAQLLTEIEMIAKTLKCNTIWEALSRQHPYSHEKNPQFDAFGFYKQHGFQMETKRKLTWSPTENIHIDCFLFTKTI